MKLFFMRHAIAEAGGSKADKNRKLTAEGREQAQKRVKKYIKVIGQTATILSSPYPRALETAKTLATELKLNESPITDLAFAADKQAAAALTRLKELAGKVETLVLVGHEPMLTQMASLLITGNESAAIRLKKAGLIGFEIDKLAPKGGQLIFLR
jgi:phosphohistidine phosphatase